MTRAFITTSLTMQHVRALMLCSLAWALPSTAHAQTETCVMLPSPSRTAPQEAREQVQSIVTDELRRHGNVVLSTPDAQLRMMGQRTQHCAAIDCAAEVNRVLGTAFAVITEIAWVGGRVTMVNIALVGLDDGDSVGGRAEVIAGDVGAATRAALTEAWDRWLAAQQGHVVVATTPAGAFIDIDGASFGRSPVRRLLRSGVHTLRATLEGYESVTREITIDRHETREIAITLVPSDASEAGNVTERSTEVETNVRGETSTRGTYRPLEHVIGPIALGAAGLGLLAVDAVSLAMTGCIAESPLDGQCVRERQLEEVPFAIYGAIGIAAIAGAVVWFVVGEQTDDRTVVRAGLGVGSVQLEGTW